MPEIENLLVITDLGGRLSFPGSAWECIPFCSAAIAPNQLVTTPGLGCKVGRLFVLFVPLVLYSSRFALKTFQELADYKITPSAAFCLCVTGQPCSDRVAEPQVMHSQAEPGNENVCIAILISYSQIRYKQKILLSPVHEYCASPSSQIRQDRAQEIHNDWL